MLKLSLPTVDSQKVRRLVITSAAVAIGIVTALFNFGEHFGLAALLAVSMVGVMLAFFFPIWLLTLLLVIVLPTTDAQLAQTPLLVPGTQLSISYLDPLLFIIFGLWLIGLITGQQRFYRSPLNRPLALFLITIVLAAIMGLFTGARPGDVWIGLRPSLMYFLVVVTASSLRSGRQVIRFISVTGLAVLIVAMWGIYLSVTGQGTAIGTTAGVVAVRNFQGAQSAYLVIGLMSVLGLIMFIQQRSAKLLFVLIAIILGTAVLLSFIRGNWVGVFVGILFIVLTLPPRARARFAFSISAAVLIVLVAISALIFLSPIRAPLLDVARERLFSIFDPSEASQYAADAAAARSFEFESGLPQVLESPVLGHGYGHYFTLEFDRGEFVLVRGFHNSYLTITYTSGVIGLFAFIWLSGAFLVYSWRLCLCMPHSMERGIVTGLTAAYLAILAASAVNFYLFDIVNVPPFMGIAMGTVLFLGRQHQTALRPVSTTMRLS